MTSAIELRPVFSFTYHAMDRFMARVWPSIGNGRPCADAREALSIMVDAAARAEMLPRRSGKGHAVWAVRDPEMRWITKPDTYRGRRVAVVVTVLGGLEDVEAEERAERDVLEAHRRIAEIPEIGTPGSTSPAPSGWDYRSWVQVETQRLSVERARLAAFNVREHRVEVANREREKTRRHIASQAHEALFCELLARLAEVDPAGSAELLERARARVAKWEAEGRLEPESQATE